MTSWYQNFQLVKTVIWTQIITHKFYLKVCGIHSQKTKTTHQQQTTNIYFSLIPLDNNGKQFHIHKFPFFFSFL